MRYKNIVVPLIIPAGTNSGRVTVGTESGLIKRCVIASKEPNNQGMVRALVKDSAGDKIAELQAIEIYRSRDVEYSKDGVPLNIIGGSQITYEVIATENFDSVFHSDLILIYEEQESC
ncbi:hypothetical protein ACI6PS_03565 [Flavobacterium sp. PLA-1-15]|uniref:hypothetical protein n=1 Tax=Flavobacterium sp. PLA-1-15 TaxID=3380533 RepID=UPI003B763281